jgi:4-hydroxy-tetrahydrodipicolinate synthase
VRNSWTAWAAANFCAIKESSGDINRVHLLARDYPHIQMSCGMDDQALEFFAWGARSWVCGGSNFLPAEHIALYRACAVDGDFDKGRRIMSALMPLMRCWNRAASSSSASSTAAR